MRKHIILSELLKAMHPNVPVRHVIALLNTIHTTPSRVPLFIEGIMTHDNLAAPKIRDIDFILYVYLKQLFEFYAELVKFAQNRSEHNLGDMAMLTEAARRIVNNSTFFEQDLGLMQMKQPMRMFVEMVACVMYPVTGQLGQGNNDDLKRYIFACRDLAIAERLHMHLAKCIDVKNNPSTGHYLRKYTIPNLVTLSSVNPQHFALDLLFTHSSTYQSVPKIKQEAEAFRKHIEGQHALSEKGLRDLVEPKIPQSVVLDFDMVSDAITYVSALHDESARATMAVILSAILSIELHSKSFRSWVHENDFSILRQQAYMGHVLMACILEKNRRLPSDALCLIEHLTMVCNFLVDNSSGVTTLVERCRELSFEKKKDVIQLVIVDKLRSASPRLLSRLLYIQHFFKGFNTSEIGMLTDIAEYLDQSTFMSAAHRGFSARTNRFDAIKLMCPDLSKIPTSQSQPATETAETETIRWSIKTDVVKSSDERALVHNIIQETEAKIATALAALRQEKRLQLVNDATVKIEAIVADIQDPEERKAVLLAALKNITNT